MSGVEPGPEHQGVQNTDRHLWPIVSEEQFPDTLHVTADGKGIGINCGGLVIVKTLRGWHDLATESRLQPIDTAPKDGSIILIVHGHHTYAAYYGLAKKAFGASSENKYPWVILDETNGTNAVGEDLIKGWMPLPEAPKDATP